MISKKDYKPILINIMDLQLTEHGENLVQNISSQLQQYDTGFDIEKFYKAVKFMVEYHGSQSRASGEPYYHHPLEVAVILVELKLDTDSIIAGLLHDTIEDTSLTFNDIKENFSEEVALIVEGVTKLTQMEFVKDNIKQAENFRKLLNSVGQDIRVLLVKLADRLHNMRTIDYISSEDKQRKIALETSNIYVKLAERIGVHKIKEELQDICFRVLWPEERENIESRLKMLLHDEKKFINDVVKEIRQIILRIEPDAKIFGRRKKAFSIWMKIKHNKTNLEQISDIIGFRVIVNNEDQCYLALGVIHQKYPMIPGSFQDFISVSKENGYQSLHTLVLGPLNHRIEVQIRTKSMDTIAEFGVAAHWRYKQKYNTEGTQYPWINELLDIANNVNNSEEFLYNSQLVMYYDRIFCFTFKGKTVTLPRGSTPVDFAYHVDINLGHNCVGAKVNGHNVPLNYVLQNGDQVEIIKAFDSQPSTEWLDFVTTNKALLEIKKHIAVKNKKQYIQLGQSILYNIFDSLDLNKKTQYYVEEIQKKLQQTDLDTLYQRIGEGIITKKQILNCIKFKNLKTTFSLINFNGKNNSAASKRDENIIAVNDFTIGMAIHMAKCCHPIPGDKIIGFIDPGKGIIVHIFDCKMLNNFSTMPERLITLNWDTNAKNNPFICSIKVIIKNHKGAFAQLSTTIAEHEGDIQNLKILYRKEKVFSIIVDIKVDDISHINKIVGYLKSQPLINSVERIKA